MSSFDINADDLPDDIADAAFSSGGYPYDEKLKRKKYERELEALQIELLKLQRHVQATGSKILVLFEGRDAAGKGGTIRRFREHMNPRHSRVVALSKPTERESSQWYFQRYVTHLPAGGEIVMFDRSWYNRAGVERVMGFADAAEIDRFLRDAPVFERLLVDSGIHLVKLWLNVGREMQLKRFHERAHDPLKHWKLSPIDVESLDKWDDYTAARDAMFEATHKSYAPWTVLRANDKRRLRLNAIRSVLHRIDYEGKDLDVVGQPDATIAMPAPDFLDTLEANPC